MSSEWVDRSGDWDQWPSVSWRSEDGLWRLVVIFVCSFFTFIGNKQVPGLRCSKRYCCAVEWNISTVRIFMWTTFSYTELDGCQISEWSFLLVVKYLILQIAFVLFVSLVDEVINDDFFYCSSRDVKSCV